jgi:hypothetical protein
MCNYSVAKGRFINRSVAIGGMGVILLLLIVCFSFYPLYILSIKDISNGKTILETVTSPGDNLWIVFINSVEGLPVADHFIVNDNYKITFTETIYQAPYAGYIHQERGKVIAPGTIRISSLNKPMEDITFYAGYTFRHMLFFNGNWLPLYEVAQGGDLIQIKIKSNSRFSSLLRRILSNDK